MRSISLKDTLLLSCGLTGAASMISLYHLFYIKVFLEKYHLPIAYLNVIQTAFLVWNGINDPLLGYVQDLGCGMKWIMDRRKVMLYMGPVFAATFLLFWFPWSTSIAWVTGAQLLVSLFIYDTLFTLVLSAYCGLCVEKAISHSDRVRVTIFGEIFGLIGGCLIQPVESITHNLQYFGRFQLFCIGVAILAAVCFVICSTQISYDKADPTENERMQHAEELPNTWRSVLSISWQILKQSRFLCLIGSTFFRMMRLTANEQFLIIFVEGLLVQSGFLQAGSQMLGLYYVLVRSFGSILFMLLWYPVNRFGCHKVIHILNSLSLISCIAMLFIGRFNYTWVAAFIFFENTMTRCGAYGYYLIISGEVIDSDKRSHGRPSPLSTIIFTLKALFTKPAESIAPIVILSLLKAGNYEKLKGSCYSQTGNDISSTTLSSIPYESCSEMFNSMFYTLVLFPVICAIGEAFFLGIDLLFKYREAKIIKKENGSQ